MSYCRAAWGCASRDAAILVAAGVLCVILSSCGPASSRERRATVVYASGADLQSINPLVAVHPLAKAVQKHVLFMTLATYDAEFQAIPRLADWVWNEDGTTLTFRLRADVWWHDGVSTRARDVVWTIQAALDPVVAYPRRRDLSTITSVQEVDSLTVRLQFERPQPVFPDVLTDLAILPAHRLGGLASLELRTAQFNRAPVGNGPFQFVEYRPNQRWVFRRSEAFPVDLGKPEVEQLVIVVVDEPTTKLAALTSGELDFAGISPAHASFVNRDPRLRAIDYPIQLVYAIVWNLRRPPFDDIRVRRALAAALDRRLIVDAYIYGFGTVADGPVPPEHPWYVEVDAIPFDPELAAVLLEQAGWRIGADGVRYNGAERLEINLMTVGSGDAPLEQMIQAQLSDIGVEVNIHQFELTAFLATAQSPERDFDALVTGIPGDFSLGHVAAMFESTDPGPLAYPGYRSVDLDLALQVAREAATESEVRSAWHEVQRILARDYPCTWLYHARGLQGANRRISNAEIDLRGELAGIARWRLGDTQ